MTNTVRDVARDIERGKVGQRHADMANAAADELDALRKENAELKAVVERLPKTADGVTVVEGMKLWVRWDSGGVSESEPMSGYRLAECRVLHPNFGSFNATRLLFDGRAYSTRAAAESALAAKESENK